MEHANFPKLAPVMEIPKNVPISQPEQNVSLELTEYPHLTHKERMLKGFPYQETCAELTAGRVRASNLCFEFNHTNDVTIRDRILRQLLNPSCAKNKVLTIEPSFRCTYGDNITVGENFFMNFDSVILDCCAVTFGTNVMLGPGVHVYTAFHPLNYKDRVYGAKDYYEIASPVTVGDNVWIGGKVVICPGVSVGSNVVIGAGSVVTKSVPANVVVAGNPAKVIRILDQ